jgi:branched-chain amino acid transport system permease protein
MLRRHAGHRRAATAAQPDQLGLAIRAVAQDEETARTMGVNFTAIVLVTFAIGSGLAAFAGMNGLYYNEINFGMGLYLGVIGFAAAHRRLGSIYGAILGGFLFAGFRRPSARSRCRSPAPTRTCRLAVVIIFMAWRPTGLIQEKIGEAGLNPWPKPGNTRKNLCCRASSRWRWPPLI